MYRNKQKDHIPLVISKRGNITENCFRGSVVIVNNSGDIISYIGNPYSITALRSLSKPFQIIPLLSHPQIDTFRLNKKEIAVMCGSHSAEKEHIKILRNILKKGNLNQNDLKCGVHLPFNFAEKPHMTFEPKVLEHNCSGNHIGMLLFTKLSNHSIANYNKRESLVQKRIEDILSNVTKIKTSDIISGIDGCSIPTFGIELYRIAYLYTSFDNLDSCYYKELATVKESFLKYPSYTSGANRLENHLIETLGIIVKIGADGVLAIYIPSEKVGISIKIESGSMDALKCATIMTLIQLNIIKNSMINSFSAFLYKSILSTAGEIVGSYSPIESAFEELHL